jgi:hypothetical protein
MTNTVKEWDLSPACKDQFHWAALNFKKKSDDGLLTEPKLVTWKACICVVQDCVF